MEQFGDGQVGDLVVDRGAEEDDPLAEEMRVDVGGTLSAPVLLDHHRDQRAHCRQGCTSSLLSSEIGEEFDVKIEELIKERVHLRDASL